MLERKREQEKREQEEELNKQGKEEAVIKDKKAVNNEGETGEAGNSTELQNTHMKQGQDRKQSK